MTTKQRFRNKYRLQLREKDHEPMHVHLVGGEVLVWLKANQQSLMKEWKKWQP